MQSGHKRSTSTPASAKMGACTHHPDHLPCLEWLERKGLIRHIAHLLSVVMYPKVVNAFQHLLNSEVLGLHKERAGKEQPVLQNYRRNRGLGVPFCVLSERVVLRLKGSSVRTSAASCGRLCAISFT